MKRSSGPKMPFPLPRDPFPHNLLTLREEDQAGKRSVLKLSTSEGLRVIFLRNAPSAQVEMIFFLLIGKIIVMSLPPALEDVKVWTFDQSIHRDIDSAIYSGPQYSKRAWFKYGHVPFDYFPLLSNLAPLLNQAGSFFEGGVQVANIQTDAGWPYDNPYDDDHQPPYEIPDYLFEDFATRDVDGNIYWIPNIYGNEITCASIADENYWKYVLYWAYEQIDANVNALEFDQIDGGHLFSQSGIPGDSPNMGYDDYALGIVDLATTITLVANGELGFPYDPFRWIGSSNKPLQDEERLGLKFWGYRSGGSPSSIFDIRDFPSVTSGSPELGYPADERAENLSVYPFEMYASGISFCFPIWEPHLDAYKDTLSNGMPIIDILRSETEFLNSHWGVYHDVTINPYEYQVRMEGVIPFNGEWGILQGRIHSPVNQSKVTVSYTNAEGRNLSYLHIVNHNWHSPTHRFIPEGNLDISIPVEDEPLLVFALSPQNPETLYLPFSYEGEIHYYRLIVLKFSPVDRYLGFGLRWGSSDLFVRALPFLLDLKEKTKVSLFIYNVTGQRVRELLKGSKNPGIYRLFGMVRMTWAFLYPQASIFSGLRPRGRVWISK